MKAKKGFSLLELILVLGIASAVSFVKFQDLKHEQEYIQAKAVGGQIKQLGDAVNGYINIHYDKLSTLTSVSTGTGADPGPRTCAASTNSCTINYQTLVNEGLLPSGFNGINANKSTYSIVLKRSGTAPNYIINGLITTNNAWTEGNKVRYDLIGKAMQAAGVDSGMTKTASTVSGYSGSWSANTADYSTINKPGVLGYRVGYDSAMYSAFLRRDGTLPMTGDLDMGGQDINHATDITASGTTTSGTLKSTGATSVGGNLTVAGSSTMTGALQVNNAINSTNNITAAGNVTSGNWVWAKNGYGDVIGLGGDAAGNDYEIRVMANKPLTINNALASATNVSFSVPKGNVALGGRIATNGLDPNDLPAGWSGGLRTNDVYAAGTVGAGSGGAVNAYINSSGNIYASNDVNVGHQLNAQYVWASGNLNSNYIHSNGNIDADSRVNVGEFVYINGKATAGNSCSPNGLQGTASNGLLLSCVSGKWVKTSGTAGFFTKNLGACLINNPDTNACTCTSGTTAYELFYTSSTEQLGGGSHGGGTTVIKDRILYQCR